MNIPDEIAFQRALSDACEDYFGLYELLWELNGQFPEATEEERRRAARTAVKQLIAEGFATLYQSRWMSGEYSEVEADEALVTVDSDHSWLSPADTADATYYCFASTAEGEARYYGAAT